MSLFAPIPSPVEETSEQALEWPRFLEFLSSFARSEVARAWLLDLKPSCDWDWIRSQHDLVEEMRLLLREGQQPPSSGLFDPGPVLQRARMTGSALDAEEIRGLALLIESIVAWRTLVSRPPQALTGQLPSLTALGESLPIDRLSHLLRSLNARFLPDGSLADDASPALRRIRGEMERQRQAISSSLRNTLRRLSEAGEAQEDLITIRGERFVIPVKAEFKRRIPGVVHGTSSSGQTVYLEPLETLEQNNRLVGLTEEEQEEIGRIFRAMTEEIGLEGEAIRQGAAVLAVADTLQAKARFASEFACVRPNFSISSAPRLEVIEARHPLLEKRLRAAGSRSPDGGPGGAIVPLTLALHGTERQLIVSGPNTGGKTIVLKTVGLLSMMAQAGIPVPAEKAELPIFQAFLADIGDAQSIERDLSTFSAHITNINRIWHLAGADSLVLLDELGSATDPEEGAALAVAIASHFLERRVWSLISTHHTLLKVYAAQRPGALNAAVGWNEKTLEPTYQLRMGVPGASAGVKISQQLGLDPAIIEDARARLPEQTKDIADFLDRLHREIEAAAAERGALLRAQQALREERSRLDREGLKEWRAKTSELEGQLRALLEDFAKQMRDAVSAIAGRAAQEKISKEAERQSARLRREFSQQFQAAASPAKPGERQGTVPPPPGIAPGDMIRSHSLGKSGKVIRLIDGDEVEVAIGSMKVRIPRSDIRGIETAASLRPDPVSAARRRGISVTLASGGEVQPEMNVIGHTVDEASREVDQFLDRAFLAGLAQVRIVHGVGLGILRKALREQLEGHPHVARVSEAAPSEGGAGATVVELRS